MTDIQAIPETTVLVGSQITLNVDVTGAVAGYRWESQKVDLSAEKTSSIIYRAPNDPGTDMVKVFVEDAHGGEIQKSLVIQIVAPPSTETPTPSLTPLPTETSTPTLTPEPTPAPLVIASFKSCDNRNDMGGTMGAAYADPKNVELVESYVPIEGRDCVANLSYNLDAWAGFYLKLNGLDLAPYRSLEFEVRSLSGVDVPAEIKIDLSRLGECSVARVSGVEMAWKTISVPLGQFGSGPCKYEKTITAWDQMDELVFVVELGQAGQVGQFEVDDIRFVP